MLSGRIVFVLLIAFPLLFLNVHGTSLPGFKKQTYKQNDEVRVFVNVLRSLKSATPYPYYHKKFKFCDKPKEKLGHHSNLGSSLLGERIDPSGVTLNFLQPEECKVILNCHSNSNFSKFDASDVNFIIEKIEEEYTVNWIVDGLPAARLARNEKTKEQVRIIGFDLGKKLEENKFAYNNHYHITIEYSRHEGDEYYIVGFLVSPQSSQIKANANGELSCQQDNIVISTDQEVNEVYFAYSVSWVLTNKTYESRWDDYQATAQENIHWLSLVDSTVIVIFLSFMVSMILLRALHKDIARYNKRFESAEDSQEDYGWKLVHADVFRTPQNPTLLAAFTGSGVQILLMSIVTLGLSLLVLVNHAIQPHLATIGIVFYALFGLMAGYCSSRIYKMMGGESWKRSFLMTALLVPGILASILVFLNFFLWGAGSSAAVPFGTLFGLICLWILVSAPLSLLGSYIGFKRERITYPVKVNEIARTIPYQTFYVRRIPSIFIGGIFPFSAIFVELYFIMSSIWQDRYYFVFGFLFVTFLLLCVTCSLSSILLCYFHLCSEDHYWWWRSFFTSGFSAFYAFAFGTFYYFSYLNFDGISGFIYFGWTFAMSFVLFVITGTIGFLSCLWFIHKIYSAIRVD